MKKGIFIEGITVEMLKNASLEAVEELICCGDIIDVELPFEKWIPVKERLPEKNQACLITNIYGDVVWNYWVAGEWIVLPNFVVAWMPLPEPYTEGNKE